MAVNFKEMNDSEFEVVLMMIREDAQYVIFIVEFSVY